MAVPDPWAPLRGLREDLPWDDLGRLADELLRWNRAIRLVGPKTREGVALQIADAVLPFLLEAPGFPFLDIGTGPGLPLLPVSLVYRGQRCVGIEPRSRRVAFVRHAARVLGLPHTEVYEGRAPEILDEAPELAGAFRAVTLRAVTQPIQALELARPFLAPDGRVFLLLGPEPVPDAPGWTRLVHRACPSLPGFGPRALAVLTPR
ncbi:16S rRNA (guanine(527)-N(7))-methyltransferase RsmG [Deferrisoma sp.]